MNDLIAYLPDGKFLLGFSGGVDSSALFFMLLRSHVAFDIAIVDYGMREESGIEVNYAKRLAMQYEKRIYVLQAPKIECNFEANARKIRYDFFRNLVEMHRYTGVILAHQLNDRLEWFLMQFSKGAGLNTVLGFGFREKIGSVDIFRPLLEVSKDELYHFCQENKIRYFEDKSNQDETFLRNSFRKLSTFLMQNPRGIRSSFAYLSEERKILYPEIEVEHLGGLRAFVRIEENLDLHRVDLECKKLGYVLSSRQRDEIRRCRFSCEIANIVIECDEKRIFVAPKVKHIKMESSYRDWARRIGIPKRLRGFIFLMRAEWSKLEVENFFKQIESMEK